MPDQHAKFAPSASSAWLHCEAYIYKHVNQGGSPASIEGTDGHTVAEECLSKGLPVADYLGKKVGQTVMTQELIDAIQEYVDHCNNLVHQARENHTYAKHTVEERVTLADNCWGTNDFSLLTTTQGSDELKSVDIVDLKLGVGVHVDAEENTQGMIYALGTLKGLGAASKTIDEVRIHIVQPRDKDGYNGPRIWTITREALIGFWKLQVAPAINRTPILSGSPEYVPTEKGCRWCSFKSDCKALAAYNLETIKDLYGDMENLVPSDVLSPTEQAPDIDALTPEEIGAIYQRLSMFESWVKTMKGRALSIALEGHEVPGTKLVRGTKHPVWLKEDDVEKFLRKHLKVSEIYKKVFVAPGKASTAIRNKYKGKKLASKKATVIEQLEAHKITPKGEIKLVAEDSKGAAITHEELKHEQNEDAADQFAGVDLGEGV